MSFLEYWTLDCINLIQSAHVHNQLRAIQFVILKYIHTVCYQESGIHQFNMAAYDDGNMPVLDETCGICQEKFTTPRSLPCLHSFCEKCLREWAKRGKDQPGLPTCPNCRKPTEIPTGGVKKFPAYLGDTLDGKVSVWQISYMKCVPCLLTYPAFCFLLWVNILG